MLGIELRGLAGAGRRWVSLGLLALLAVLPRGGSPLVAAGYRFILPTVECVPGQALRWTIQGDPEESIQGFSMALRYPSADVQVLRVHFEDTILEAMDVDYFEAKLSPEDGTLVVGVLADSEPPFDGRLIPAIDMPLDYIHLELLVLPHVSEDLTIRLEDGLSTPPIRNLFVVENREVYATELGEGGIHVVAQLGTGAFVRGDFNMDRTLDISDPIAFLGYRFLGLRTSSPRCLVAGDANDDETLDLSDAVYLLQHLFLFGSPPPPPDKTGGPDPTPGPLDCENPLFIVR
jgi:hypothetical protein